MRTYSFKPARWSVDKDGLDDLDKCPIGLLSFDGESAPQLSIFQGHLVSESTPMEHGGQAFALDFSRKAVFGYSNDNNYYVLRDAYGLNTIPFMSPAFKQQDLHGQSIIVANHRIDRSPAISELTVNLSGFSEWIRTYFSHEIQKTTENGNHELEFTYSEKDAHDILLYHGDGFDVYANHSASRDVNHNAFNGFSFKETWQLDFKIQKPEGMVLDDVLKNLFEPFEQLITFCMGLPGDIEEITFAGTDTTTKGRYFDLYVPGKKDSVGKIADNMPLPYPEVKDRFQNIADKWMNATGYALNACNAASALLGKWDKAIDVMFLLCAQSLEAISQVETDLGKPSEEDFEQKKRLALENIRDKELREWAEKRIKRSKYVTADDRIKSLWSKLGNFADAIVPNKELFLKQHRESRNAYTHMRESNNPFFLTGNDLYWHAHTTQVLQYGAVLLYLGFQPNELLPIFRNHNFMTSHISKAQEIYASEEQHQVDAEQWNKYAQLSKQANISTRTYTE